MLILLISKNVIQVLSPCAAFGTPGPCCENVTPQQCVDFYNNYDIYKLENKTCNQQYLFPYDDAKSTFVCSPGGAVSYNIKFCWIWGKMKIVIKNICIYLSMLKNVNN